ncbi:MAG: serine hydrolase [Planctomycetes bacterium]|nr:serine hydrolase [Planctomycetota bacterium]
MNAAARWVAVGFGLSAMAWAPARGAPGSRIPEDVKRSVESRVDGGFTVGMVVGVIDAEGTEFFAYGTPSKDIKRPVDEDTVFEIGSITKVFTTLLLAESVERGKLELDEPIRAYLPKTVSIPARHGSEITFRHLATHRSGLPRLPDNLLPKNGADPYSDYSADSLYAFLSGYALTRDIDSAYEYSNLGAGLLGHTLARTLNRRYERLIVDRICKPLGMDSTGISLSPSLARRLAAGHTEGEPVQNWDFDCLAGCGAIRSSARDLAAFISVNMGLTDSPLYSAMKTCHGNRFDTGVADLQIALGWHVWNKFGTEIIWHNGGTGGSHSFCGFAPDRGIGVVVLSNSTHDIDDIGLHMLESRFKLKRISATVEVPATALDAYLGYYELQPGIVFHVTRKGDDLYVQLTGQPSYPVYASSLTEFYYKVVDAQLTFVTDDDGPATALILHQGGLDQEAKRIE